jgi:hypothetical protein
LSTNDYVKFVTQQIVTYIDQPKDKRKAKKKAKKNNKLSFQYRWFGMIPLALSLLFKKK